MTAADGCGQAGLSRTAGARSDEVVHGVRSFGMRNALATTAKRFPIAVALFSALVVGLELLRPVSAVDPGVRAGLETAITLSGLLSAYLLLVVFEHRRRLCDLLLLVALVTLSIVDFAFVALPALTGVDTVTRGAGARLTCEVVVSIAFAAAAFAPSRTVVGPGRRPVVFAGLAAIGTVAGAGLVALIAGSHWAPSSLNTSIMAGAAGYPVSLAVHVLSSGVLFVSGIAFVAVAFRLDAELRLEAKLAAARAERQRIARDLHDGLAQDLAIIAAHGPQLACDLGPEHPLVIAARRILAASRGATIDLSASEAPTTGAALRQVADELEARFAVRVNVRIKPDTGQRGEYELDPAEREEVVRIAREAIVNAVLHGGAHRIDVELDTRGPDLLRVSDNGCGIGATPTRSRYGFGLPTMRARAESIGGRLVARRKADGGTELEVRVL